MASVAVTRGVLGATSVVAAASVIAQYPLSLAEGERGFVYETLEYFSYFTIVSNIVVAVSTGLFAANLGRREHWAGALRIAGLVMITITGVVYHALLAADNDATGLGAVTDAGLHTVVPLMTVIGWLFVGPHRRFGAHILARAMIIPIGWLVYALVRDAITGVPLYPFMDVAELGWGQVATTLVAIALFATALGFLVLAGDRWLPHSPIDLATSEEEEAPPTGASQAP